MQQRHTNKKAKRFNDLGCCVSANGGIVIIASPLADLAFPVQGAHVIQAIGRMHGYKSRVIYTNMSLAYHVGIDAYKALSASSLVYAGEALFSQIAYQTGINEITKSDLIERYYRYHEEMIGVGLAHALRDVLETEIKGFSRYVRDINAELINLVTTWVDDIAAFVIGTGCNIVGASTMFPERPSPAPRA